MNLSPGQHLGRYEITDVAGVGGMGEVYKARDSRLDRTVAIKVLPQRTSQNADLRARFEREAKAISSLNHPNICTLYDVGHEDGMDYLVMEYIEGESLAARLTKGPMPLEELLPVAVQIAEALDSAHRQGLIHRDLKPSNVMLTRDGAKLLDFGLAKLQIENGLVAGVSGITQTTPLTGAGTILGTLQYMAPEQLEGKEADPRSDIFAFGAVIYEMATGKRAFDGGSQASLIAAVLERKPAPLSSVNALVPPALERLVQKCLEKDPESRWQSMRDLTDELRWVSQSGSRVGLPAMVAARRRFRFRLGWTVATIAIVGWAAFAGLYLLQPKVEPEVSRFYITPSQSLRSVQWPCLSPNGRYVSFLASDSSGRQSIWVRPLNSLDAYPLPGTEGASRPFWSPDSRYLGFTVNSKQIKKIPVTGGPAQLLGEARTVSDGAWGSQGTILLDGGPSDSIRQISAGGGPVTAATTLESSEGETSDAWPWFLPDGKHFLFLAASDSTGGSAARHSLLKVGELGSMETKTLFAVDSRIQYVDGYLLYVSDGILLAQPFDPDKQEVTGDPTPLAEKLRSDRIGLTYFSASDNGTLVFQQGAQVSQSELVWLDRTGTEIGKVGSPGPYGDIALSPGDSILAYGLLDSQQGTDDIWVRDLNRNVSSRLTFDPGNELAPIWTPDGLNLVYASNQSGRYQVMQKAANGMGEAILVFAPDSGDVGPCDITRDGRRLAVNYYLTSWDIEIRNLFGDSAVAKVRTSPFNEWAASLSPDGQYMAYVSNESGRNQIYVVELSQKGGKWQISTDGGLLPQWSRDGKELFYYAHGSNFMVVPVSTANGFRAGQPQKLFSHPINTDGLSQWRYAVSADRQRILVNSPGQSTGSTQFILVQNWAEDLKHR